MLCMRFMKSFSLCCLHYKLIIIETAAFRSASSNYATSAWTFNIYYRHWEIVICVPYKVDFCRTSHKLALTRRQSTCPRTIYLYNEVNPTLVRCIKQKLQLRTPKSRILWLWSRNDIILEFLAILSSQI